MDDGSIPAGNASGEDTDTATGAFDDLFAIFGTDGQLRRWNRAVVAASGKSETELASIPFTELLADGDVEYVRSAISEAIDTSRATVEASLRTRSGHRRPYEFRIERLADGTGDESFLAAFGHTTSARWPNAAERQSIFDRMTDAFFAVDENWRLSYVNEQARPILTAAMGREIERLEGLHLWDEIPEAVGTAFYESYHEAMATQEPVTIEEYFEPLGTWFEVQAYPSETGLSIYFRDVTEQREQQVTLQERERVLREMYDVISDTERSFEQQVAALLELGCTVIGTDYGTLSRIQDDEYVFEVVRAPGEDLQAGDTVPLSTTNCERAAATQQTLVLANIAEDAPDLAERSGNAEWGISCYLGAPVVVERDVYGTFCFYDKRPREKDFSEWEVALVDLMSQWVNYEFTRRRAREQLERQNDQLEGFASIVSHDLRNPLHVLGGSLELAQETGVEDHFERCRRAVERMESLIDDLLTLARAGETIAEPERIKLASVVEAAWQAVETADAMLTLDAETTIRADEGRLQQLFENLLRNAIEHGGEDVSVTIGDLEDGFYLADDGPGIPAEERERVFEAGYSTAKDGTGFGLNIVGTVAEAHGWGVTVVESSAGGARFEFAGVES